MQIGKRSGRRLMNQINVVPYLDVMLVLLVIFMITAPLVNPGQVELPSVGKVSKLAVAPLEVSVRADQTLWLRDRAAGAGERQGSRHELIAAIRPKKAGNAGQGGGGPAERKPNFFVLWPNLPPPAPPKVEPPRPRPELKPEVKPPEPPPVKPVAKPEIPKPDIAMKEKAMKEKAEKEKAEKEKTKK